jgi:hypothetical protein
MKTQFLFFVFKLLPTQKEKVLFPDRTRLPLELILKKIVVKPTQHYGNLWQNDFIEMGLDVKETLDIFLSKLNSSVLWRVCIYSIRAYSDVQNQCLDTCR